MQQPVDNENDMDGDGDVNNNEPTEPPQPPPHQEPKSKETDESDDEDSSLGATLGLILVAILICVGIGIGVYFGVAAILSSVKQNRIGADVSNATSTNETKIDANFTLASAVTTLAPTASTGTMSTTSQAPPNRLSPNLYKCDMASVKLRGENWNWQVRIVNEPITTNETERYYPKHDRNAVRHTNVNTVCSGTILSNFTVLTSAECCTNLNMSETSIYAGIDYDAYYERNVASFKVHEGYQRGLDDDHANENDLCMIELDKNILYSNGEQLDTDAICLPNAGTKHLSAETKCFAGGYGSLEVDYDPNQDAYRVFDETELSLITDRNCRRTEQSSTGFKYGQMFCADYERLEHACILDVGSPLVCVHDNRPFLYGFLSHSYQCGEEQFPAVLAKIVTYLEWINSNMFDSGTADLSSPLLSTTVQPIQNITLAANTTTEEQSDLPSTE